MQLSNHELEQMDLFLQGKLTSQEHFLFTQKLKNDADFAFEYQLFLCSVRAAVVAGRSRDQQALEEIGRKLMAEGRLDPPRRSSRIFRVVKGLSGDRADERASLMPAHLGADAMKPSASLLKTNERYRSFRHWFGAVAGFFLLLILGWAIRGQNAASAGEQLYQEYFVPFPDFITRQGEGGDWSNAQRGIDHYNRGEYADAVGHFELVEAVHPQHDLIQLYLGICFLEQKELETAKTYFAAVAAQNPPILKEDARWYLGLAYVRAGRPDLAAKELQEVVKMAGERAHIAGELLKHLDQPIKQSFFVRDQLPAQAEAGRMEESPG